MFQITCAEVLVVLATETPVIFAPITVWKVLCVLVEELPEKSAEVR